MCEAEGRVESKSCRLDQTPVGNFFFPLEEEKDSTRARWIRLLEQSNLGDELAPQHQLGKEQIIAKVVDQIMKSAPVGVADTLSLFAENPEESKSRNEEEKNLHRILHQLHRFAKEH